MNRRSLLSLLVASPLALSSVVVAAPRARADEVYLPPPRLELSLRFLETSESSVTLRRA